MIRSISYSLYSLKSLYDLARQIQQTVQAAHPEHPMLRPFLDALQKTLEKTLTAIGKNMGSTLTTAIKEADSKRDDAFVSLRDHVQAGLRRLNPTYREAADKINRVFEQNNPRLYVFAYAEQSAALTRLISDLENPIHKTALETLHAWEWSMELKAAQQNFEQVYTQRVEESAGKDKMTEAEAKKELTTALQILIQTLGVLEATASPEGILETVKQLNVLIEQAQATARR
ncbi:MAG: DUF6261 family protein [Microscillaceae bacterium]|nr:DUF6261 family protein [Microscillaceae bacterium]